MPGIYEIDAFATHGVPKSIEYGGCMMKFLFGALLVFAAVLFMVLINGDWQMASLNIFLDGPSLLFLLLVLFGFVIASGGQRAFSNGVTGAFSKSYELKDSERAESILLFKKLARAAFCAGAMSFIIHNVMMLGHLNDVNVIVANLVLSITATLYAILLNLVFIQPVILRLHANMKNE